MKHVAIIGAGLSGLACAFYLLERGDVAVTLFDAQGVGGGASGVAAGLVHPYPGEQGRCSWRAHAALQETLYLLDVSQKNIEAPVAHRGGILRLRPLADAYSDVEPLSSGGFLIHSGVTVHMSAYLEGLFKACVGVFFEKKKIARLDELSSYDQIIVCAGYGIFQFPEAAHFQIRAVKGHVLECKHARRFERSVVGKGYLAVGSTGESLFIGATYEKNFATDDPCLETAQALLKPKIAGLGAEGVEILGCKAGVRVSARGHYLPKIERMGEKVWALTAMGSRGLLYHAYLAKQLVGEL